MFVIRVSDDWGSTETKIHSFTTTHQNLHPAHLPLHVASGVGFYHYATITITCCITSLYNFKDQGVWWCWIALLQSTAAVTAGFVDWHFGLGVST